MAERVHGSASTYLKHKCRCDLCSAAAQIAYSKKNANRNAKRAGARVKKLNAAPLIEFIDGCPPKIRDEYTGKFSSWAKYGVDIWTADEICISLSTHPVLVFGQTWINAALEEENCDNELVNV
jgi:hypothetical protein